MYHRELKRSKEQVLENESNPDQIMYRNETVMGKTSSDERNIEFYT